MKLQLYLVDEGHAEDDKSMLVWAHDADEAERLWRASAILWQWNISPDSGAHVRLLPTVPPRIASVVEWSSVDESFVYTSVQDERIILHKNECQFELPERVTTAQDGLNKESA